MDALISTIIANIVAAGAVRVANVHASRSSRGSARDPSSRGGGTLDEPLVVCGITVCTMLFVYARSDELKRAVKVHGYRGLLLASMGYARRTMRYTSAMLHNVSKPYDPCDPNFDLDMDLFKIASPNSLAVVGSPHEANEANNVEKAMKSIRACHEKMAERFVRVVYDGQQCRLGAPRSDATRTCNRPRSIAMQSKGTCYAFAALNALRCLHDRTSLVDGGSSGPVLTLFDDDFSRVRAPDNDYALLDAMKYDKAYMAAAERHGYSWYVGGVHGGQVVSALFMLLCAMGARVNMHNEAIIQTLVSVATSHGVELGSCFGVWREIASYALPGKTESTYTVAVKRFDPDPGGSVHTHLSSNLPSDLSSDLFEGTQSIGIAGMVTINSRVDHGHAVAWVRSGTGVLILDSNSCASVPVDQYVLKQTDYVEEIVSIAEFTKVNKVMPRHGVVGGQAALFGAPAPMRSAHASHLARNHRGAMVGRHHNVCSAPNAPLAPLARSASMLSSSVLGQVDALLEEVDWSAFEECAREVSAVTDTVAEEFVSAMSSMQVRPYLR